MRYSIQYVTHTPPFYFTRDSITDHTASHSILAHYYWYSIIYMHMIAHDILPTYYGGTATGGRRLDVIIFR